MCTIHLMVDWLTGWHAYMNQMGIFLEFFMHWRDMQTHLPALQLTIENVKTFWCGNLTLTSTLVNRKTSYYFMVICLFCLCSRCIHIHTMHPCSCEMLWAFNWFTGEWASQRERESERADNDYVMILECETRCVYDIEIDHPLVLYIV